MPMSTAVSVTDAAAMQAVSAAMREAATTPSGDAVAGEPATGTVGTSALQWMSRMTYTGSYVLSYGVVYAAVFVAQSLPQENSIMRGFRDGGREATDERRAAD
jgi:hypothetical protein